jgi:hypothetical protein
LRPPTYASFKEVYNVGLWIPSKHVRGKTGRHAAWRADRGIAVVSFLKHDVMDADRSTMILNTFVVGMLVFGWPS